MSGPTRGVFVTGTDTGVGKTLVACALVRALRRRGIDVGVMKPVETGVGEAGPLDALALREAAGGADSLPQVCPLQLPLPAAPTVAARVAQRSIEVRELEAAFRRLAAAHELVVAEGAGGIAVPVTPELSMGELAGRLGLPLLVVARGALGTLNHTRLTLDYARTRGLAVLGVVISHATGALSPADAENLQALREELGEALVGEVPPLPAGSTPEENHLAIDRILARLRG